MPRWRADIGRNLSPAEEQAFRREQTNIQNAKEAKWLQAQAHARRTAKHIIQTAVPAIDTHTYLSKKGIGAHGVSSWEDPTLEIQTNPKTGKSFLQITHPNAIARFGIGVDLEEQSSSQILKAWQDFLILPMQDDTGTVQSLQFISKFGDKKFLYGGRMQGCYMSLGRLDESDIVLIAEGFATAATIRDVTGHPTIVAFNAGNLEAVARTIRKQKPDAHILICADDDWKTKNNPGLTKAKAAADAIGGTFLLPEFGPDRPEKATDFNDMAAHAGKDAVTRFFTEAFSEETIHMLEDNGDKNRQNTFTKPSAPDAEQAERPATPAQVFVGTIAGFGPAPYRHDKKNNQSFFIDLKNGDRVKTVWGVDLADALVKSGHNVGDEVAIYDEGKKPVQVKKKVFDENGNVIGEEEATVMKGLWRVGSLADYIAGRIQTAKASVSEGRNKPSPPSAKRNEVPRPAPEPKLSASGHFDAEEVASIQKIWAKVPRAAARHSDAGYDILFDSKNKVRITKHRIEAGRYRRMLSDETYLAACEHAECFWGGQMEVRGDAAHRLRAWAFATAGGVKVTNYTPSDSELVVAQAIIKKLQSREEAGFSRPANAPSYGRRSPPPKPD